MAVFGCGEERARGVCAGIKLPRLYKNTSAFDKRVRAAFLVPVLGDKSSYKDKAVEE